MNFGLSGDLTPGTAIELTMERQTTKHSFMHDDESRQKILGADRKRIGEEKVSAI